MVERVFEPDQTVGEQRQDVWSQLMEVRMMYLVAISRKVRWSAIALSASEPSYLHQHKCWIRLAWYLDR